jgi:hypothetical protein
MISPINSFICLSVSFLFDDAVVFVLKVRREKGALVRFWRVEIELIDWLSSDL